MVLLASREESRKPTQTKVSGLRLWFGRVFMVWRSFLWFAQKTEWFAHVFSWFAHVFSLFGMVFYGLPGKNEIPGKP